MAPGFRYHLLTLIGIFLALGIGMVIGTSYVQGALVAGITNKQRDLNQMFANEVGPLREENRRTLEKIAGLRTQIVGMARLRGRAVIVQTGDYPDAARDVRDTLASAGITVTSTTTIAHDFQTRATVNLDKLMASVKVSHPDLTSDPKSLLRVLASALAHGAPANELDSLESARLIDRDGAYDQPNDYAILVGGVREEYESRADTVETPLIALLKQFGVAVFYVEPKTAAISNLRVLDTGDAIVTPEIDTDLGRIALALAIRKLQDEGGYPHTERASMDAGPGPATP